MDRFVQLLADLSQRDARHVRCDEHAHEEPPSSDL